MGDGGSDLPVWGQIFANPKWKETEGDSCSAGLCQTPTQWQASF